VASADVMAITKWSISGSENEPRCGRGVDPRATAPALAMLHLTRFQEFKVPSTFGQVLFETVDKVIPDGHAKMPFVGVCHRRLELPEEIRP